MRVAAGILEVGWFERIDPANWPPTPTIDTFVDGGLDVGVFLWADAMYMGRRARAQLSASRNVRVVLGATVDRAAHERGHARRHVGRRRRRGWTSRRGRGAYLRAGGGRTREPAAAARLDVPVGRRGGQRDRQRRPLLPRPPAQRGAGAASTCVASTTPNSSDSCCWARSQAARSGPCSCECRFPSSSSATSGC